MTAFSHVVSSLTSLGQFLVLSKIISWKPFWALGKSASIFFNTFFVLHYCPAVWQNLKKTHSCFLKMKISDTTVINFHGENSLLQQKEINEKYCRTQNYARQLLCHISSHWNCFKSLFYLLMKHSAFFFSGCLALKKKKQTGFRKLLDCNR